MWMKRNICRECWNVWRPGDSPQTIPGVFGDSCEICGSRNHDGIYLQADEHKMKEVADEIDARKNSTISYYDLNVKENPDDEY